MLQDFRIALRSLLNERAFTAAAVLSLAIGIGGNVAIFSLIYAVLLRPLPFPHADRLVNIATIIPKVKHLYSTLPVTASHLVRWQKDLRSIDSIGALRSSSATLTGSGEARRLPALYVSPQIFDLFGTRVLAGRPLGQGDAVDGAPKVVVLAESLWRGSFAADPAIIGKTILLNGQPHVVAAVVASQWLPSGRQLHPLGDLPLNPQLFFPLRFTPSQLNEDMNFNLHAIARLRPTITLEQLRAEIEVLNASLAQTQKEKFEFHTDIESLHSTITGGYTSSLTLFLIAVGLVLLVVCVNLANLTLVRSAGRRKEYAIRSALGAGRRRLLVHSLLESVAISILGTVAGLISSVWIVDFVKSQAPMHLPRLEQASLELPVVLFAVLLCFATAILFGLLPAWRAAGSAPVESLQTAGRGNTDGPRGNRLRGSLVALEVAMSTALLICSALLLTSFYRVLHTDRGFQGDHTITANIALSGDRYKLEPQRAAFLKRLLDSVSAVPAVIHAGYVSAVPLTQEGDITTVIREGGPDVPLLERPLATWSRASAGYFPAIGIPLRSGRLFADEGEKEHVAVISETAARKIWAGQNAIGKRFRRGMDNAGDIRVVGIVGDMRGKALDRDPEIIIYQPCSQRTDNQISLLVRSSFPTTAISSILRDKLWEIDRDVPFPAPLPMDSIVSNSLAQRRFQALLTAIFAAIAVLLSCVGVYGVAAYAVAQRRAEIGIRLALGATQTDVRRFVLHQGMRPVVIGLAAGVVLALAASRFLTAMLFGLHATDPLIYSAVVAVLALTALAACYLPARRAALIPPMQALRQE